jgi:hypothetical protein
MAKRLQNDPIIQSDIEAYLQGYSDFSFELQVLKELNDLEFQCEHGGTYEDPITNKPREFDIRALLNYPICGVRPNYIRVHLSVECKNIRDNYPFVTHCVTRKEHESYNDLIHTFESKYTSPATSSPAKIVRNPHHNLYPTGNYVAKSTDQVGREAGGKNEITATDGGIFEKISQAINSAKDLVWEAYGKDTGKFEYLTLVCPVLIIPDSVLWQVKYADDGTRIGQPELTDHVTYFIGHEWTAGVPPYGISYSMSHLEILTFSKIKTFARSYLWNYIRQCESHWEKLTADD